MSHYRPRLRANIISLYGVQLVNYVVPLVTLPYLARILDPRGWGVVLFYQAVAQYIILIGEYAFEISGTRKVAANRADRDAMRRIVGEVVGARLLLVGIAVILLCALSLLISLPDGGSTYLWVTCSYALAQTMCPMWYFQGIERLGQYAGIQGAAKLASTAAIFLLVRGPQDGWRVLAAQGGGAATVAALGMTLMFWKVGFGWPKPRGIVGALREGFHTFLFRVSTSLYTTANVVILGAVSSTAAVGYYGAVERLVRALVRLLAPVTQSVFPKLAGYRSRVDDAGLRLVRSSFVWLVGCSIVVAGFVIFLAPVIVRIALGRGYDDSIPVLRTLVVIVPLIAGSNVLGIQWMLARGVDRPLTRIVLLAGVFNAVTAATLGYAFGAVGVAISVVATESFVTGAIWRYLSRNRLNPMSIRSFERADFVR